jgi:hypothetical protein
MSTVGEVPVLRPSCGVAALRELAQDRAIPVDQSAEGSVGSAPAVNLGAVQAEAILTDGSIAAITAAPKLER